MSGERRSVGWELESYREELSLYIRRSSIHVLLQLIPDFSEVGKLCKVEVETKAVAHFRSLSLFS